MALQIPSEDRIMNYWDYAGGQPPEDFDPANPSQVNADWVMKMLDNIVNGAYATKSFNIVATVSSLPINAEKGQTAYVLANEYSDSFFIYNGTSWINPIKATEEQIENLLPTQTGQSGKFLTTNGTTTSWAEVDALPSQAGNNGKYLTTNGTTARWENLSSRNIGELVYSLIPLTDAGLHLADGTLIDGSGVYSAFVSYMANLYDNTQVTGYKSNVCITGTLSNFDGVISGFSSGNYATILKEIPFSTSTDFEMVLKINMTSVSGNISILGNNNDTVSGKGMVVRTINGARLYCWGTTNGTAWTTNQFDTGIDLTTGDQYIKITYDGTQYTFSKSTDGETYTTGNSATSTPFTNYIVQLGNSGNIYFLSNGSIDLKESYIKINGDNWWLGTTTQRSIFSTEEEWQFINSFYGVCGKFVINTTNQTIRLPKITGIVEGTLDNNALGDLVEAGLPDHKHNTVISNDMTSAGTTYDKLIPGQGGASRGTATFLSTNVVNNPIYGNSTTVQPQTIKGYYYIVIATSPKTDIQVDIDQIVTDLNNKADKDLSNTTVPHITEMNSDNNGNWYKLYSNGWCEQGGQINLSSLGNGFKTITYLVPFSSKPNIIITVEGSTYANYGEVQHECNAQTSTAISFTTYLDQNIPIKNWIACGYKA